MRLPTQPPAPTAPPSLEADASRQPTDLLTPGLIHEMRHPLLGIKAGLQLIAAQLGDGVTALDEWTMVTAQVKRLEELFRSYQEFLSPEHVSACQFPVQPVLQQAVNSRDADIVERLDAVAHHVRREQRFFSDRDIAGAGRNHRYQSFPGDFAASLDGNHFRSLMELRRPRRFAIHAFDCRKRHRIGARHENIVLRIFFLQHRADNLCHLCGRLSLRKHDLRKPLPQSAVMVHLRKPQILERQMLQPLDCRPRRELAGLHRLQNLQQFLLIHRFQPSRILPLHLRPAAA